MLGSQSGPVGVEDLWPGKHITAESAVASLLV